MSPTVGLGGAVPFLQSEGLALGLVQLVEVSEAKAERGLAPGVPTPTSSGPRCQELKLQSPEANRGGRSHPGTGCI